MPDFTAAASANAQAACHPLLSLVAGPFADSVQHIWSDNRLGEYFCATDARRHVWHACLSSEYGAFSARTPEECEQTYSRFTFARGKDLIAQAFGCRPKGFLSILGRLGLSARPAHTYRALCRLLERDEAAAKLLRHATTFDDRLIAATATIPEGMQDRSMIVALAQGRIDPGDAPAFLWALRRVLDLYGPEAANQILAARRPVTALLEPLLSQAFPPAPWPGDEWLRPVSSAEALAKAGSDFGNCLMQPERRRSAIQFILQGQKYFYRWEGEEPALLEVVSLLEIGWFVSELCGRHNAMPSPQTRAAIARALNRAPSICPVSLPQDRDGGGHSEFTCRALLHNMY